MLDSCLEYLCERMNQSINSAFDLSDNLVIVASPSDINKQSNGSNENKVLIFISGLERDPFSKGGNIAAFQPTSRSAISNKPLFLAVSVVVAANFSASNYTDGLKILSHLLAFFNRNPLFNRQNSPDMPEFVEQIAMEMATLTETNLSHMWSMLGSHYLPSCVYQVRVAIPNSEAVLLQSGPLNFVKSNLKKREQ
ncbi:DUF4255 domain-containing protein [Vibrio sp. YYF0003]|uniref:DUF4255 domain-containing protein n=1 Tax=Vibrio sp. YYF0003 TaxID=3116646 RepID=UPI002EB271C9|nr:DUF4255 domain-containing protein [Vibrio sp. YYF0003]